MSAAPIATQARPLRSVQTATRELRRYGQVFKSAEEVLVFDAIVAAGRQLPQFRGLLVSANVPVDVGRKRPFVVDLLVAHRGRVAGAEVDGPHHRGRFAADASRDSILIDHGLAFVEHVVVEETGDPAELATFAARLLSRLDPT